MPPDELGHLTGTLVHALERCPQVGGNRVLPGNGRRRVPRVPVRGRRRSSTGAGTVGVAEHPRGPASGAAGDLDGPLSVMCEVDTPNAPVKDAC